VVPVIALVVLDMLPVDHGRRPGAKGATGLPVVGRARPGSRSGSRPLGRSPGLAGMTTEFVDRSGSTAAGINRFRPWYYAGARFAGISSFFNSLVHAYPVNADTHYS
jgi:hypothetical protein